MATEVYKERLIIYRGYYDQVSGAWKPDVTITWQTDDGKALFHSLKSPLLFRSEDDAINQGLHEARIWIDQAPPAALRRSSIITS